MSLIAVGFLPTDLFANMQACFNLEIVSSQHISKLHFFPLAKCVLCIIKYRLDKTSWRRVTQFRSHSDSSITVYTIASRDEHNNYLNCGLPVTEGGHNSFRDHGSY